MLLALPLRKDFHPLRGEDARSDERGEIWHRAAMTERVMLTSVPQRPRRMTVSAWKQARQLPFASTTPPVKIAFVALRRVRQTRNYK